jgi:hypothetical protein
LWLKPRRIHFPTGTRLCHGGPRIGCNTSESRGDRSLRLHLEVDADRGQHIGCQRKTAGTQVAIRST